MAESGSFSFSSSAGSRTRALRGGFVGGVFENVPAAEDQIVQAGQRNEILDVRGAAVGALAEADGGQLRERSDGQSKSAL